MKRLLIVFLLIVTCQLSYGQNSVNIDSLSSVLADDSQNVSVLIELVDYYKTENLDSLNHYASMLIIIAKNNNNELLINKVQLEIAEGLLIFNKSDSAQILLDNLLIDDNSNIPLHIKYLIVYSKVLVKRRQFDDALEKLYAAVEYIKMGNESALLSNAYNEIAFVLSQNNDLENSMKYYGYAFSEAQQQNNTKLQVEICYRICRAYNGGIMVNLDSSVYYGELGLEIAQQADYEKGYADMLNIVAAPVIRNGEFRRGLEMSKEALTYADKYSFSIKSKYYLTLNQGFAYEKLGVYDSAIVKMEEGATIRPTGIDHFRLQYLIYKSKGEFEKGMAALERYEHKKDSVIRGRNEAKLSSLQARYEANIIGQEVVTLTQKTEFQTFQLNQQRYFLLGLGVLVFFVLGGAMLVYRQRKLKQQQLIINLELTETKKRLNIEQQYRASELKALRSQMNPHFVFNALNSIQEYIMLNEKKLAGKYLGKFADLMRIYLNHSQAKSVTIQEEVVALNLYLELEKLRFEELLTYKVSVDDEVDAHLLSIPSLLIQPYVENALKHGLLHKKGERVILVKFGYDANHNIIQCEIIDNGIGRVASLEINKMRNPDHKSFATKATKNRLDLLNYNKDKPIGEHFEDLYDEKGQATGTKVTLNMPVEEFVD